MNKYFLPKGKNIITESGCRCKNEFRDNDNNLVKDSCTLNTDIDPWCEVEDECGVRFNYGKKKKWIDYCNYRRSRVKYNQDNIKYGKNFIKTNLIGFLIYLIFFVISIPYLLYTFGYHHILEFYMPNFDLIATSISFQGGPGKYKIFSELYNNGSDIFLGVFSSSFINYISLMGMSYLVIRRAKKSNSYSTGLCIGLIMLLITYLLPNQIIKTIQNKIAKKINFFKKEKSSQYPYTLYILIICIGFIISILFIILERFLINHHHLVLQPLIKYKILE